MGPKVQTHLKLDDVLATILLLVEQIFVIVVSIIADFRVPFTIDVFTYATFRDVSLMVFVGMGFLVSFQKESGLSAVGYCLVLCATAFEQSVAVEFLMNEGTKLIAMDNFIRALFCAMAVMVSFGAVLGKVTLYQLTILCFIEVWVFWANYRLIFREIGAHDVGGGMFVFLFGAYFGIASSWWLSKERPRDHENDRSSYSSDRLSLFGTVLLWVLWPSFMAARAVGVRRQVLARTQTLFALSASVLAFGSVSRFLRVDRRFSVVHLQRATLAGAVGMSVIGDVDIGLYGSIAVGFLCGSLCCFGFTVTSSFVRSLNIHDTVGVHDLFALPGLVASIAGIIVISAYGDGEKGSEGLDVNRGYEGIDAWDQSYALLVTIGTSLAGGFLAGFLMVVHTWLAHHFGLAGLALPNSEMYSDFVFFDSKADEAQWC